MSYSRRQRQRLQGPRLRPSASGTHASRASGLRMMLGWKGVKHHLPSKVAKAVPHWLSKKKRENHGADTSTKDQSGRYYSLLAGTNGDEHQHLHMKGRFYRGQDGPLATCCLVVALHNLISLFATHSPRCTACSTPAANMMHLGFT